MQIYRNPKAVLPRPLESAEDILPACTREERFAIPDVDGPPRDGQSDPIQASARDLGKIFFGLDNATEGTCESMRRRERGMWRRLGM